MITKTQLNLIELKRQILAQYTAIGDTLDTNRLLHPSTKVKQRNKLFKQIMDIDKVMKYPEILEPVITDQSVPCRLCYFTFTRPNHKHYSKQVELLTKAA